MDSEPVNQPETEPTNQAADGAPSQRARTLREEILGSALSLEEVAYILSLDRTTVAKYLREGTIAGFQIGREWLVPEEELRRYVKGLAQGMRTPVSTDPVTVRGLLERVREDMPLVGSRRKRAEPAMSLQDRFNKFTERARHAMALAQEEAISLGHHYIGTEHLLLGLAREEEGVAAIILTRLGADQARLRSAVEFIVKRGEATPVGEVGFTPRSKKAIELAVDEARRLGHQYLGTEHLLLGLLREEDGIGADILESLGITLQKARVEMLQVLQHGRPTRGEPDDRAPDPAPPVPPEAASLVGDAEEATICAVCGAQVPRYFRYCFNCGIALGAD